MIANTYGKIFRANAPLRQRLERFFDDAIFERMKRYHRNSSADFQSVDGFFQGVGQNLKFAVDFNPNRLENSFRGMTAVFGARNGLFNELDQFAGRLNRRNFSRAANGGGDSFRETFLAVFAENFRQAVFVATINHVACRQSLSPVHAHIERRIFDVRKAAFSRVNLM